MVQTIFYSISRVRLLCLAMGLAFSLISGVSYAQETTAETTRNDVSIPDISGHWDIEVINRPNSAFKGTAFIPHVEAKTVLAETITEDVCCNNQNHARVLQDSRITIDEDGNISVDSKIVKFLLREEKVSASYSPDDFELRQVDANTLIGTANGYLRVRWVRQSLNLS